MAQTLSCPVCENDIELDEEAESGTEVTCSQCNTVLELDGDELVVSDEGDSDGEDEEEGNSDDDEEDEEQD